MSFSEETVACPKCGDMYPLSEMHTHYNICTGKPKVPIAPQAPQSYTWNPTNDPRLPRTPLPPVEPKKESEVLIKQEVIKPSFCKVCGNQFIETDFYKVCARCKTIKTKAKMFWWIALRYGMMIFWLAFALGYFTGKFH